MNEVIAGRYRLDSKLGAGSFAEVHACTDLESGARYALKLAPPSSAAMLEAEARLLSSFHHPNVARVYGQGRLDDGRFFLVIELGEETLRDREKSGPLPWRRLPKSRPMSPVASRPCTLTASCTET